MASLRNIFVKGVELIFDTFEDAVKTGSYNITVDTGFVAASTQTEAIRCIFENFTEKDVELLTFSDLIQPNDVKGLIPAADIALSMNTQQGFCLFSGKKYTVEGFDLDPMSVIYTVLLRKS